MSAKKPAPTPSERDAARIVALERECAGWMDAAGRSQRECDAIRAHIDVTQEMLDEIQAALPPAQPNEFGLPQRVKGVVSRGAPYATQQALHRIADAVGHAYHPRDGVRADEVADAVGAYVRRHEHPAVLPAPSERVMLAHLLDVLDACDVDEPARHTLAAVRAVVGVPHAHP